jgi:hypothetical protein
MDTAKDDGAGNEEQAYGLLERGLDLTYWVEYFTAGLHEQLKSVEKSVKKSSEKILGYMKQNPLVSAVEMAKMLSLSSRAVEK